MAVSFEPWRRFLDGLVHGSVAGDPLGASRHRAFIAANLLAGLAAVVALPVWLALARQPSAAAAIAFLWLLAPLAIAAFLSRTGRFATAHLLSAAALSGLVVWVAALTGGLASPALVWLALVPAEAALSNSRRVTTGAVVLAMAGLLGVGAAGAAELLPAPLIVPTAFGPLVILGAVLYAGLLAFRIDRVHGEAEAEARESAARYRLLADNATDLITRHGISGDVEFASPAARSLAGCAPAALTGRGLFERVHVADRPAYLRALSEAERTGDAVTVEFRLRRGEGSGFTFVEMRCRPALDPQNGRRSVVSVTRDISEHKAQQAAFAEACSAAEQANRSKSRFLANMSHELRTPLNAILGFSEILEQQLGGRAELERQRDYARLIRTSGEHLLGVVNGILDMSKIEAGKLDLHKETFAASTLIDGVAEMMSQRIAARGLRLVRRIERGMPELFADRRACRQMLINLLSNAAKFTEPGGTVTVAARMDGGNLVIEVSDTGIGIAAADLPRLGMPFVQADADMDRRYEGTGLGLSVVKGLVSLHGGSVAIDSEPGRGTTVTIRLPAVDARGAAYVPHPEAELNRERKIA